MSTGIPKQMLKTGGTKDMLQKELFVVSTKPAPGVTLEKMREMREPHLAFQVELERRGIMFGAGPLFPPGTDMWQGEGMVIIRAASHAEATEIAASDPMHKSGMREFTVREWMMNEGTITLKVSYSNGKAQVI